MLRTQAPTERTDSPPQPVAFEWDEGNVDKNWQKHGVRASECEEVFFNQPLLVHDDPRPSAGESRHLALGQTHAGRRLCVAFTYRNLQIRDIDLETGRTTAVVLPAGD